MPIKQQRLKQAHTSNSLVQYHIAEEERAGCSALIVLYFNCVVAGCVLCLFVSVPWDGRHSVIMAFPGQWFGQS